MSGSVLRASNNLTIPFSFCISSVKQILSLFYKCGKRGSKNFEPQSKNQSLEEEGFCSPPKSTILTVDTESPTWRNSCYFCDNFSLFIHLCFHPGPRSILKAVTKKKKKVGKILDIIEKSTNVNDLQEQRYIVGEKLATPKCCFGHADYFELKTTKPQQTQEETLTFSLNV